MEKIQLLNESFIKARKEKNSVASALFSTFRGEYDTAVKNGKTSGNETVERIAKKMTENAKTIGTPDAMTEIELLRPFMPEQFGEDKVRMIVKEVADANPDKADSYKSGSKGAFMGMVMKQVSGKADASLVTKVIEETLA
jgi:Asp-tRNA(Asn)/Glu-tRNA(Gln) amidotransferase B subunit